MAIEPIKTKEVMKSNIKNTKGPKKAGPPPAPKPKGQMETKTKEQILQEHGCPELIPFDENVTMFYPAILEAMDDWTNQQNTSQQQTIERLREWIKKAIYYLATPEDEHGVAVGEIVFKLEQLLNTTEPVNE